MKLDFGHEKICLATDGARHQSVPERASAVNALASASLFLKFRTKNTLSGGVQ